MRQVFEESSYCLFAWLVLEIGPKFRGFEELWIFSASPSSVLARFLVNQSAFGKLQFVRHEINLVAHSQPRNWLYPIIAAEGVCTKTPMCSPHCPKYKNGFRRVSISVVYRELGPSWWNSDERRSASLFLFFLAQGGGSGEWCWGEGGRCDEEAKWRMSRSALMQENVIFSLILTVPMN